MKVIKMKRHQIVFMGNLVFAFLLAFFLPSIVSADVFYWQNTSGVWTDTTWLMEDLVTPKTTSPTAADSAAIAAGTVKVSAIASITNVTISGTGNLTIQSAGSGSAVPTLNVSGTLDVQTGASLTLASGSGYNCIGAGTTLKGAGDIHVTGGTAVMNSKKTDDFTGTIHLTGGSIWVGGSTLKNATISLEGGQLRNNGNDYAGNVEIASSIVINTASGSIRPGWGNLCLTLSGVISNGTGSTLSIATDSNESNWVVLTNANNTFTNLVTNPASGNFASRVRVTSAGALGAVSGTVTNNGYLDLYGTSNSADNGATIKKVTGQGTVVNNKSNTTAALYLTETSALTIRDSFNKNTGETVTNSKMAVIVKGSSSSSCIYLTSSGSNYSGGLTLLQGVIGSAYGNAFGTGTLTLSNGTTLFNNTHSVEVSNDIYVNGTVSVRSGWRSNFASMNISGDIHDGTSAATLNLHFGEANPSVLMFSGNNTYTGGTKFNSNSHFNLIVNTNSAFGSGTFNTTDANTQLDFNTGGTWGYASYMSLSQADAAIFGFNYDLANRTVTLGNSGYTTKVTAEKSGTLSFTRANDSSNIYITDLTTGTRTTLFSAAAASYNVTEGHDYQIDVRYAADTTGNFTVSDDGNLYSNLSINQDGSWSGISTITSARSDWTVSTPFNIGTRTLTLTNTGVGTATFAGTVDGSGTLVFDGTRNGAMGTGVMAFNGTPLAADDAFSVSVASNTRFTGNGTIGGNLTFADGTAMLLSKNQGDLNVHGNITLSGDTDFVIDVTGIKSDKNWGVLSASSTVSGFSDDNLSFTFTGAPDLESLTDVLTLTVFGGTDFSGQISTEQLSQILDFSAIANSAVVEAAFTNDGLVFRLGNSASLPEPTS